jgi:hypothetical protein
MTRTTTFAFAFALAGLVAACGGGLGEATRADITNQMLTAQQPIGACYGAALQSDRHLHGLIKVHVATAPATGQFASVQIVHDEMRWPALRDCVVAEVGKLHLAKPKKVEFEIPLRFAPSN